MDINLTMPDLPDLETNDGHSARIVGTRLADSQFRFVVAVTEWPEPAESPEERIYYASATGALKEPNVKKTKRYLVAAREQKP